MKHFITGTEFTVAELQNIIKQAMAYKNGTKSLPNLTGKLLTLIFANPSLRTRLSFESGMKKMQGGVNVLNTADSWGFEYEDGVIMNQDKAEHIKESARVMSLYCDILALRKSELMTKNNNTTSMATWAELKTDQAINQLAKYATKPVINMESNMFHPCQAMADMQTMYEHFGEVKNKKLVLTWAPHPKALPLATPHSQLLLPNMMGMNVTLACPPGFELDKDVINLAESYGNKITIEHNQNKAFQDAEVIIAKSWASLEFFGKWEQEQSHRQKFANWTVDSTKMALTNNAIFMHCLPVRRNVVVTDEVLDSVNSKIISEAENRMWVQMAIVSALLE